MHTDKIRVAILSFWHVHAKDYAKQAMELPDTELAAVCDEDPVRGHLEAEARGLRFEADLDTLLADPTIDGVIVTSPTVDHPAVITAAARAGKAIFTEKVIALTTQECETIMNAVAESGAPFTVSLPRLYAPFTQGALAIQQSGLLGKLTSVRARLSHSGALPCEESPLGYLPPQFFDPGQAGGGAMVDLGCHPMYLVRLFLGMPERVSASFGYVTDKQVEDNALAVLHYDRGAIGIVEAGFVNRASPFTLELHGTEGSAIYSAQDATLRYKSLTLEGSDAKLWHEYPLPSALPSAFEQWVSHIRNGTRDDNHIQLATQLTVLMEAASQAAKAGAVVAL
jgi:1,5-anhydro-D-fructose reductase (1,5-anhydro-D-mannitol-forming)